MEVELQSELQKEREKRMAIEGEIAAVFQQYFGKVPKGIANLMSKCTQVNMSFTKQHLLYSFMFGLLTGSVCILILSTFCQCMIYLFRYQCMRTLVNKCLIKLFINIKVIHGGRIKIIIIEYKQLKFVKKEYTSLFFSVSRLKYNL